MHASCRTSHSRVLAATTPGGGLVAVLLVALLVLCGWLPTATASPTDTPTTMRVSSGDITLTVTSSQTALTPDQQLQLDVTVTNNADEAVTTPSAELFMSSRLFTMTSQVREWYESTATTNTARTKITTSSLETIEPGASASTTFEIDGNQLPTWRYNSQSGVLGFGVRLTSSTSDTVWQTTALPWRLDQTTTAPVNVVVPITASSITTDQYTAAQLSSLTSTTGSLTRQLDAVDGLDVQLAVDPRITASIAALGDSAPQSARDWADRLNDFASTQSLLWGDADPTALAAAGVTRLESGILTDPTNTVLTTDPTHPLSDQALSLLTQSNLAALIVPTAQLGDESSDITVSQLNGTPIIGANSNLSDAITAALSASDGTSAQRQSQVVATAAVLTVSMRDFSAVTTVLPRDWYEQATQAHAVLSALQGSALTLTPGVQVTAEISQAGTAVVTTADDLNDDDRAALDTLATSRDAAALFASVCDDAQGVAAADVRRIASLAAANQQRDDSWRKAVTDLAEANSALASAVSITSTTNLTLISGSSQIPVAVRNDSDQPITVGVVIAPNSGRVTTDSPVRVSVDPHSSATATVPVRAIANGTVVLDIHLANAAGESIGEPVSRQMDVKAEWETIAIVAFVAATGSLFGFGLIKSIVTHRRQRRAGEESE